MSRINVIGGSGSGKTELSRQLAKRHACNHVQLDSLFWGPNWTRTDTNVLKCRLDEETKQDSWVIDGDYRSHARDIIWDRATQVVFLDLPLYVTIWRLLGRSIRRWWTQEELWNGNRESLRNHFLVKDALIPYTIRTFQRRRSQNRQDIASSANPSIDFVHLHSSAEVKTWLEGVGIKPKRESPE